MVVVLVVVVVVVPVVVVPVVVLPVVVELVVVLTVGFGPLVTGLFRGFGHGWWCLRDLQGFGHG
jgi:hypothetical protein